MQIGGRWVAAIGANRQDLAAQPLGGTVTHAGPNGPSGWDAGAYDRLSDPQYAWGQRVIGRLELRGDGPSWMPAAAPAGSRPCCWSACRTAG